MTEYTYFFIKYNLNEILYDDINIEKYSCPICFDSIDKKEIYQCKEGHWFCKQCWVESLSKKKECMICRAIVNSFSELSRNRYLEQDFLNKKVYCPNSFKYKDENNFHTNKNTTTYNSSNNDNKNNNNLIKDLEDGCKDIIIIGEIEKHLKQCKFTHIKCKYIGCNKFLRLNKVEKHEKEQCEFRLEYCRYCDTDGITSRSLQNHYRECPKFIVKCSEDGCEIEMERANLQTHVEKYCQMVLIDCPYKDYGCNTSNRFPRSQLTDHINKINHTLAMGSMIEKQSLYIKEVNERCDEMSTKINQLEQQETESKCDQLFDKFYQLESKIDRKLINIEEDSFSKGRQEQITTKLSSALEKVSKVNSFFDSCLLKYKNRWSISNYLAKHKNHKKIASPQIEVCGKMFQLVIYPQGNLEEGYISVFLKSFSETPIKVFYKFTIINWKDQTKNATFKNKTVFDHKKTSSGCSEFIKSLETSKKTETWLQDDVLVVDFSIEININNDITPLES
ncbi:hypothetical protein RB653_007511 [Dictyostelium firmibasis]|uniref:TNF receptor-associated factor family protein n=1 Tax=Dictyostelium firmibasis TaxID=79012 RepID=A0AAN7TWL5_9MYCE